MLAAIVQYALINRFVVDHIDSPLIDKQGHIVVAKVLVSDLQCFQWPARDAHIERLSRSDDIHQGLQSLLQRCLRVVAMAVKEVDIVQSHSPETLVDTCHKVFARSPIAVRSRPHVVACLRGNEELVAIAKEIVTEKLAHRLFCRAVGRSIVVGKVEVSDAVVESVVRDVTRTLIAVIAAKVVPKAQTHFWQQHA